MRTGMARRTNRVRPRLSMLMKHVNKTETCWLWTGALNNKGYGAVSKYSYTEVLAHRAVWVHSGFELKPTDCLLHSCDNPCCVNTAHLYVGTKLDNTRDMMEKGRNNNPARITKEQVLSLMKQGHTQTSAARQLGVVQSWACRIVNRT